VVNSVNEDSENPFFDKLTSSLLRFREKAVDKVMKVFSDEEILDKYSMHEGKEIAIQILEKPERVDQESNLIMIRTWDPQTWELTPVKEIYVP
jgi:hypothetical protein